jgi:hypothetical protein
MRFAWLKEKSVNDVPVNQSATSRLIYIAYNVIWWMPIVLPFTKVIDYRTGFIAFLIVTIIRAVANLYRNNFLTPEQAEIFPLRAP